MGRRVTFLTPRATVSHPGVPFAGRRPHFRQHNSAPSGRSSNCGRGSDRCPPGRPHSLGDVSHWRGVLSLASPTQAGASEPRKLRGCKGSAGRLAGGAGGRESRGQGGRAEHLAASCSQTTRAAAVPQPQARLLGRRDFCKAHAPPTLCRPDSRPGGGAERPSSAFRSGRPSDPARCAGRPSGVPALSFLAVPRPPLLSLPGTLAPGSSHGSVLLLLTSSPDHTVHVPRSSKHGL